MELHVAERFEATYRDINKLHFVVIGAYVADCFVAAPRLPRWGEEYEVRSIRTSPGGKALNQAVALARLGAHVSAIGAVGEDGLGRDIMSALTREGIETEFFITCEKAATSIVSIRSSRGALGRLRSSATECKSRSHGFTEYLPSICICFVGDNGQTSFVWHIDEGVAVTAEIVRAAEAALRRADAVLVTFEAPVPTIQEVLQLANHCDAQVFLQPAPPLSNRSAAATLPWGNVDVLIPNEAEARAILEGVGVESRAPQKDDLADALASELGVPLVVVTLGESGCVSNSSGVARRYSAQRTAPVDTTGASDAFAATLAAYLVGGRPEMVAIEAATAAAATSISRRGGHESMPFQG